MEKKSIKNNGQIYWSRFDKHHSKRDIYDLGLAHGNASYLYFLSKCKYKEIEETNFNLTKMIDGIINFYNTNSQDICEEIYSFFPGSIDKISFDNNVSKAQNSRLAWCYGDLGIFHSILLSSILLKDSDLKRKVIKNMEIVSLRKSFFEIGQTEGGFCHGTCGISYLYIKNFILTGNKKFLNSSKDWIKETLKEKRKENQTIHGYNLPIYNDIQNNTLLEGLAGVSISYLKFLTSEKLLTDEILFLSL